MTACLSTEQLHAFRGGRLPPDEHLRVNEHLQACAQCAARVSLAQSERLLDAVQQSGGSSATATTTLDSQWVAISDNSREPVVGDDVLGYRLDRALGRGAMGMTWLAKREREVEPVVLKLLPGGLRTHEEELSQVRRVFDLVKVLRHPHIAMVFQLGEDPRWGPVLVMEYVPGATLRRYMHERVGDAAGLPPNEVVRLLEPIAAALDYAHSMRLVHRDVKPSNVMLQPDGSGVRLIDFGLGDQIRHSITNLSMVEVPIAGTAPYMSPEQWRGHAAGPASDQYSLACVAYELLAGRPPFTGGHAAVLSRCHLEESVAPLAGLSPEVSRVFWTREAACALAKSRDRRFPSCNDFVVALKQAAGGRLSRAAAARPPAERRGVSAPRELPRVLLPRQVGSLDPGGFRKAQIDTSNALRIPRTFTLELGLSFALIPRGTFMLGLGGERRIDESGLERPREVEIASPFYLARWPVTLGAWQMIVGAKRKSPQGSGWVLQTLGRLLPGGKRNKTSDVLDLPVADVAWSDVAEFVAALNRHPLALAPRVSVHVDTFRLPTEAEWEFACRAGSTADLSFGGVSDAPFEHAWLGENAGGRPHLTATLTANAADLFDMHGNVWEWTSDGVLRGGDCKSSIRGVASHVRMTREEIGGRGFFTGLRVAATIHAQVVAASLPPVS